MFQLPFCRVTFLCIYIGDFFIQLYDFNFLSQTKSSEITSKISYFPTNLHSEWDLRAQYNRLCRLYLPVWVNFGTLTAINGGLFIIELYSILEIDSESKNVIVMITLSWHVQKLWTSMHNSAYDCDKKNLIAPLNSLGTLEIYHVIKTAN